MKNKIRAVLLALGLVGGAVGLSAATSGSAEAGNYYVIAVHMPKSAGWCNTGIRGDGVTNIAVSSYSVPGYSFQAGGDWTWMRAKPGWNQLAATAWCAKSYPEGANPWINVTANNQSFTIRPNT
jgi:hypothetical protein